ncbi:MAG: hypothetical protein K9W44_01145 [Candidatus Lokiarchaeota archaeon]|nr:hypothetical protein [Candidatus Harpocratesius repetitus]
MTQKSLESNSDSVELNSLINIKFRFFSTIRNIVGTSEIELSLESGIRLKIALQKLQETYFLPKKTHILNEAGNQLEVGIICLIDDVDINLAGGLNKKINQPCSITLISSLHGG